MFNYKYIVIEGNIGAGKTTLANMLSEQFNAELVLEEFADNTFLSQFYEDPDRFAFPLEMSFMAERYRQLKNIFDHPERLSRPVISDYLFEKSLLFAQVNLKEDEFRLFKNFFDLIKSTLPKPDLLVFLKKEVGHLKKNIQKRGRNFEKKIPDSYLHRLNESYDRYLETRPDVKMVIIDSGTLDFVSEKRHLETIINKIMDASPV